MPKQSSKRRPTDMNQLAASIVATATATADDTTQAVTAQPADGKNPAAVALGRLGGLKGGAARAKKLSARRRKEIAKKAARARWRRNTDT